MRLPLAQLEVFSAIARAGSLRGAAQALELRPSTVSHQLKTLEASLGASLFVRTTRSVRLTAAGKALHEVCAPALLSLDEACRATRSKAARRGFQLRVDLPELAFELVVRSRLASFLARNPAIELELRANDSLADITADGFHAGIRRGEHVAQDMVAVRLTSDLTAGIVAAPDYLARHAIPSSLGELVQHNCVQFRFPGSGRLAPWILRDGDGLVSAAPSGNSVVNSMSLLVAQVEAGIGLGYVFLQSVQPQLRDGRLVALLERHHHAMDGLFLYFPKEYQGLPALRAFISHFKQRP